MFIFAIFAVPILDWLLVNRNVTDILLNLTPDLFSETRGIRWNPLFSVR